MKIVRKILVAALAIALIQIAVAAQRVQWPTAGWTSTTPKAVGLDARLLAAFDADIAAGKYGYVDSILVIRHGKVAFDRSYKHDYSKIYGEEAKKSGALNANDPTGPYNYFSSWWHPFYRRGDLHSMQSVTKTVTSVVIGVAVGRKEFPDLDTPILKFFDQAKVTNIDDRKRRVTIRHLLTMTGGFEWNENLPYIDPNNAAVAMEASFDWVDFTINRPMAREPGTVFNYSSGETQLLSYIFRMATGRDIEEYAAQHLFAPLGINNYFWKRTPTGLIDTEGGLYLAPRDLAKISYLYLKGGIWEGKPLVPADWVKASIAPSVSVSNTVKYGYKWWLHPYGKEGRLALVGSGFGGQHPIAIPEMDLIVVVTGWNIVPNKPNLPLRVTIDRILGSVMNDAPR